MDLSPGTGVFVLALTIAMCVVSAAIAMRKVRSADPAEIF
jgi:ABC-type antimicrobial peptide transport system permease subunit